MDTQLDQYHHYFLEEIKRRMFAECQIRVHKCLDMLSLDDIWYRPNEQSNSVGNLVLHLCGNIRQWILSTLGGQDDTRERQKEFDTREKLAGEVLREKLDQVLEEVKVCLAKITPEDLIKKYRVQGFEENGISILVHVTEHFSYHVGQITYFVKGTKNHDVGYYQGQDLDQ